MTDLDHAGFAAAADQDRIPPSQYKALTRLIYAETGIAIKPGKQTMLEGRLRRAARAAGMASVSHYCEHLLSGDIGSGDLQDLINAVTTNKTDFFREPGHFDYLVDTILPSYIDQGKRRITCWSAACSSGAEPYTLAMLLEDFVSRHRGIDYKIVATDLDTAILEVAVKGIYPREQLQPVPELLRKRFVREARNVLRDPVRIAPELRRKVSFGQINLISRQYPLPAAMDLIFCRNVLIYFDRATQEEVVERLCENLEPGGYLFLGHSESIAGFKSELRQVGSTIFQKV